MKTPKNLVHDMISKNTYITQEQSLRENKQELFRQAWGRPGKTCPKCGGSGKGRGIGKRGSRYGCDECIGTGLV